MSLTELLNSRMPLPSEDPISGSRFAPNRSSTMRKMKIISPIPNPPKPIITPSVGTTGPVLWSSPDVRARKPSDQRARYQSDDGDAHQRQEVQCQDQRPQLERDRDEVDRERSDGRVHGRQHEVPRHAVGEAFGQYREQASEKEAEDDRPHDPHGRSPSRVNQHTEIRFGEFPRDAPS